MFKSGKYLWSVGLFFISLSVRLALLDYVTVKIIEADGVGYIAGAKGFLDGFDIRKIGIVDHPLFPVIIAFFSYLTPDWETAGRMVSIVSGSFIGPLAFLISSAKGNSLKVSVFAGLFIAVSPLFITTSFNVWNNSLNCALLVLGVWQLTVAIKARLMRNYFLSGLSFALAYLTRPDSIVPSFFAFLFLTFSALKSENNKNGWKRVSAFILGFSILAVPYLFYLHASLGKWVITGRQVAAMTNLPALTGEGNYEDANYGLTEDLTLKGDTLRRATTGGTDIRKGVIGLWMENPDRMFSSLLENIKIEWNIFVNVVPWYIKFLAFMTVLLHRKRFVSGNWPLFVYSTPLIFLYPFFWADARHIYHFLFPLWLWAAEGVESLFVALRKLKVIERVPAISSRIWVVEYLVYLMIIITFISYFGPKEIGPKELHYLRQKEMGVWISKNTPKDAVVMARWGRLTFYTDRKTVMFPYAEWEIIKKYMKKNGVTHLVVDEGFFDMRPQVRHILTPIYSGSSMSPDNLLSIIGIKRHQFGGMIVYEVKKVKDEKIQIP